MINPNKLAKIEKLLGPDTINDLKIMPKEELVNTVVQSEVSIKTAQEELEANEKYQELKEAVKAMSAGLREVKQRQNAIIQYCLHLKEEGGQ
jgi:hypothetical protein